MKQMVYDEVYYKNEEMLIRIPRDINTRHHHHQMIKIRDSCEPYFRLLIKWFYQHNILDDTKNIVDLGAWIGDNSIPWAKRIRGNVYAIDPSIDNIEFIKELMLLNGLSNVIPLKHAVSDKEETVYTSDDHHHVTFNMTRGRSSFKTTSLDILFRENIISNIGFIHLDVEGFELKVLRGSIDVIKEHRPVVVWEGHLDTDDISGVVRFFTSNGYSTYMINETFPHCRRTCRNFLSIPHDIITCVDEIQEHFLVSENKADPGKPFLIERKDI